MEVKSTQSPMVLIERRVYDLLVSYISDLQLDADLCISNMMIKANHHTISGKKMPKNNPLAGNVKHAYFIDKPADFFSIEKINERILQMMEEIKDEFGPYNEDSVQDVTQECYTDIRILEKVCQISSAILESEEK